MIVCVKVNAITFSGFTFLCVFTLFSLGLIYSSVCTVVMTNVTSLEASRKRSL